MNGIQKITVEVKDTNPLTAALVRLEERTVVMLWKITFTGDENVARCFRSVSLGDVQLGGCHATRFYIENVLGDRWEAFAQNEISHFHGGRPSEHKYAVDFNGDLVDIWVVDA
mgnify:FL=1